MKLRKLAASGSVTRRKIVISGIDPVGKFSCCGTRRKNSKGAPLPSGLAPRPRGLPGSWCARSPQDLSEFSSAAQSAEARKLELDNEKKEEEIEERKLSNELKRIDVFDSKIEIAKKLVATEKDFEPLLRKPVLQTTKAA